MPPTLWLMLWAVDGIIIQYVTTPDCQYERNQTYTHTHIYIYIFILYSFIFSSVSSIILWRSSVSTVHSSTWPPFWPSLHIHTSGPTARTPSSNRRPGSSFPKFPLPHERREARSIDPPFATETKENRVLVVEKNFQNRQHATIQKEVHASHPEPLPVQVTHARTARDGVKLWSCRNVSLLYYVVAQHLRYQDPIPWCSKQSDMTRYLKNRQKGSPIAPWCEP